MASMAPLEPMGSTACNRGTSLRPVGVSRRDCTNLQRTRRLLPQFLENFMTYEKKHGFFEANPKCHFLMHQISTKRTTELDNQIMINGIQWVLSKPNHLNQLK